MTLIELIATIAIVLSGLAYTLWRFKTKSSTSVHNTEIEVQEIIEDAYETPLETPSQATAPKDEPQEHTPHELGLEGAEEGSFETQNRPKSKIQKRTVPAHEKITKEHFSEFQGKRLLIAEDNIINQKVLSSLLADSGIDVVMANDGQEALDILEKDSDFLMILMDAHMPRVDGFEASRTIRANPKYDHILICALSGDVASDDLRKMSEAGMQEQLAKPIKIDELYNILYAYSEQKMIVEEDEIEDDGDIVEVVVTKQLHGDEGLAVCGGDDNFYHEILAEFVKSYANSPKELQDLLNRKMMKEADKMLLDIIGVTANIGAANLNSIAKDLKEAIKKPKNAEYVRLFSLYSLNLSALLQDIREYEEELGY